MLTQICISKSPELNWCSGKGYRLLSLWMEFNFRQKLQFSQSLLKQRLITVKSEWDGGVVKVIDSLSANRVQVSTKAAVFLSSLFAAVIVVKLYLNEIGAAVRVADLCGWGSIPGSFLIALYVF